MVYLGAGLGDHESAAMVGTVKNTPWIDADGQHHTADENYEFNGFEREACRLFWGF